MRSALPRLLGATAVCGAALSLAVPTSVSAATPPPLTGQSNDAVSGPSNDFDASDGGWQHSWSGVPTWTGEALDVSAANTLDGAASPGFAVTPGARYLASAEVATDDTSTSTPVAAGLRFYDKNGQPLPAARQLGQSITPGLSGKPTPTVVGLAPAAAVTADAIVVRMADSTLPASRFFVDNAVVRKVSGVAAAIHGPLTTNGTEVRDSYNRAVQLHGVMLGGMKNKDWSNSTVSTAEIDAMHRWGANFVRLPLAENPAVKGDKSYSSSYLTVVDRIVKDATSRGMVISLDLHSNALTPGGDYSVRQKLPDSAGAVAFWKTVAARYKANPLVAFDLYNEPYGVTGDQWLNGAEANVISGLPYKAAGMKALYDAVRGTGAKNLVFVGGNQGVLDQGRADVIAGATNLVVGLHSYVCSTTGGADAGCSVVGKSVDPTSTLDPFTSLTRPLMVTDFGYPDPSQGDYIANVASYATSHGWVGWSAFVVNNFATGAGFELNRDAGALWDPNPSGMAVILGMLGD